MQSSSVDRLIAAYLKTSTRLYSVGQLARVPGMAYLRTLFWISIHGNTGSTHLSGGLSMYILIPDEHGSIRITENYYIDMDIEISSVNPA